MNDRRFIARWAFFLLGFAVLWTGLYFFQLRAAKPISRALAELFELKKRAASAPGPKVVLLGGSGVWFTLHAETAGKILKRPVVNAGLTIGLGPDYLFHFAREVLRPGDTAVLILEYPLYDEASRKSEHLVTYIPAADPAYFRGRFAKELPAWIFGIAPEQLVKGLRARLNLFPEEYPAENDTTRTTPLGDMTGTRLSDRTPGMVRSVRAYHSPDFNQAVRDGAPIWTMVRDLHAWCRARDITLLAAFPVYPDDAPPAAELDAFFARLDAFYDREGIPRLGTPWESLYPRGAFFDSPFHLVHEEGERRTAVLAAEIAAALPSPQPAK